MSVTVFNLKTIKYLFQKKKTPKQNTMMDFYFFLMANIKNVGFGQRKT